MIPPFRLSVLGTIASILWVVASLSEESVNSNGFFETLDNHNNFIVAQGYGPERWGCSFTRTQVHETNGGTMITIGKDSALKPYSCGELIYKQDHLGYGTYTIDMIASNIVGQVTSFFLIAHGSSEIDIELTGLNPNVCWMTVWYEGKQNPVAIDLPFDASQSWHTYQFDWRPNQIVWSVDGRVVLTRSDIPTTSPDLANYKLEINSWTQVQPETKIAWAGMFNYPGDGRIPQAFYRNMRFQPWDGSSGQAGDGTNGTSGNGSPQQTPHTTPVPADNLQNGKPSSAESSKNPTGFMRVGSTAMVAIAVTFAILF